MTCVGHWSNKYVPRWSIIIVMTQELQRKERHSWSKPTCLWEKQNILENKKKNSQTKNKKFLFLLDYLWRGPLKTGGCGVDFKYTTNQNCTIFIPIQFGLRVPIMHHLTQDSWDTKSSQYTENNASAQWLGTAFYHMLGQPISNSYNDRKWSF